MERIGKMLKLHLGCGGNLLEGWENRDYPAVNVTKRLPWGDGTASFIFTEHMVEHLKPAEAWGFFEECRRVLRPGGVVRTSVPSVVKVWRSPTEGYAEFLKSKGWGDGSRASTVRHLVFLHGHRALWTPELLMVVLEAVGFQAYEAELHRSAYAELVGVESHWKAITREWNDLESVVVEAVR